MGFQPCWDLLLPKRLTIALATVWLHRPALCLQGLEERFLALIEPKLAAALSQKNGQRVQQLSGMLLGMESTGTIEKLYNTARMAPLQVCFTLHCLCRDIHFHWGPCFVCTASISPADGHVVAQQHSTAESDINVVCQCFVYRPQLLRFDTCRTCSQQQ